VLLPWDETERISVFYETFFLTLKNLPFIFEYSQQHKWLRILLGKRMNQNFFSTMGTYTFLINATKVTHRYCLEDAD